jgi:lysophospholipase L1-like esterase
MKTMRRICCLLLLVPFAAAQTVQPPVSPAPAKAATTATPATAPTPEEITHMENQLQDWPDLARYQADNAATAAPAPGENRVVFMGDSITDFWGHPVGTFFPGKPYFDRGISGQTSPQMLIRFRPDVIALQPKVVVILAGTNDIAENTGPSTPRMIHDNLTSMVELAHANHIRVVLSSVLPAAAFPWRPAIDPVEKIRALNIWIKDYCAANGDVYLDYYSAMIDPSTSGMKKDLTGDGVHPNAAGYAVMSPLAEKAIAEALAQQ